MSGGFNPARRQLFRGDVGARRLPQRPPWSLPEEAFIAGCTRCDACIQACPESIIERGSGGFPQINFEGGECTFCAKCVGACPRPLFRPIEEPPWTIRAVLGERCVTYHGVECRRCEEECEPQAIRLTLRPGQAATPYVSLDDCTGCGACVAVCPTQAITLQLPTTETELHAKPGKPRTV